MSNAYRILNKHTNVNIYICNLKHSTACKNPPNISGFATLATLGNTRPEMLDKAFPKSASSFANVNGWAVMAGDAALKARLEFYFVNRLKGLS